MATFNQRVADPVERPILFRGITFTWLIVLTLTLLVGIFNWNEVSTLAGKLTLSTGKVMVSVALIWLILSVKKLNPDEVGAILLFGLPMVRVGRGPQLVIAGVFELRRFAAFVHQNQFPAEPELIQKTDDSTPLHPVNVTLPDGQIVTRMPVRPIRITTAAPDRNAPKDDILNVQMTVEFTFWVRWLIVDPFNFMVQAVDEAYVVQQLRDRGESFLNAEVVKRTPSKLVSEFDQLQQGLEAAIKGSSIALWGISIEGVGLTAPDLNHEVAQALRDIPKAKAQAEQKRINTEATAFEKERLGKAEGIAQEEVLAGKGRGYKRAAASVGVAPVDILTAEVARDTVGEGDLILGAEGIAQAIGLGKKILEKKG